VERKRVFITVKTYPTISAKYAELVCTAGVLEDGSWIRLYPLPFRMLDNEQQFKKYTWINVGVEKNTKDFRPESYRPFLDTLEVEQVPENAKADWEYRKSIAFKSQEIYTNKVEIIRLAKTQNKSLLVFKPTKIKDLIIEKTDADWNSASLQCLQAAAQQLSLFQTAEEVEREFKALKKIPYKFSYCFEDDAGQESTLMIEDWELGMLYLNCLKRANGSEEKACQDVRNKYYTEFMGKDLHLFLGTTLAHHKVSVNPFIIIGVFYPPKNPQQNLFGVPPC